MSYNPSSKPKNRHPWRQPGRVVLEKKSNYQPKGSMCLACERASQDCSNLPFSKMPVIEHVDMNNTKVVRCILFKRGEA